MKIGIGIGVTTYNRPKHFDLCKKQISDVSKNIHIFPAIYADDSIERKGIAYRKNQCLRMLQHCEYVFLFDDDCFPIKEGWADFFIDAHKASGQHHFLYLKETPTIKQIGQNLSINIYNNCAGAMMFLTKEAIEKVGAFDERFGLYGFEHANYSKRIHMAGLTPMGEYLCPAGAGEYIYSLDLDNHLPFNKQVQHNPSMPITEILSSIEKNRGIFAEEIKDIHIPL